jgi:hypothetical protein
MFVRVHHAYVKQTGLQAQIHARLGGLEPKLQEARRAVGMLVLLPKSYRKGMDSSYLFLDREYFQGQSYGDSHVFTPSRRGSGNDRMLWPAGAVCPFVSVRPFSLSRCWLFVSNNCSHWLYTGAPLER